VRQAALDDLNKLKEMVDSNTFAPVLQQLQQRTWLMHWSFFIFFNHENGRNLIVDFFFQERWAPPPPPKKKGWQTSRRYNACGMHLTPHSRLFSYGQVLAGYLSLWLQRNRRRADPYPVGFHDALHLLLHVGPKNPCCCPVRLVHGLARGQPRLVDNPCALSSRVPGARTRRYLNTLQTTSQHLLRYLAVAVVVNKRRRNVLKDLIRIIQQESYEYSDPITRFLQCLFVDYDFEGAQQKLKECEEVRAVAARRVWCGSSPLPFETENQAAECVRDRGGLG
jgi:hypothetical protein